MFTGNYQDTAGNTIIPDVVSPNRYQINLNTIFPFRSHKELQAQFTTG